MNLFDLIKRSDRSVVFDKKLVIAEARNTPIGHHRFVDVAAGASIRINSAHEFSVLSILTENLGWFISAERPISTPLTLTADFGLSGQNSLSIPLRFSLAEVGWREMTIDWPSEMALAEEFDLTFTAGPANVSLVVGPLVNFKRKLLTFALGRGIEVGPGLTPQALPSKTVDVTYIEEQNPREWARLYVKGQPPLLPPDDILRRYRQASACELEGVEHDSFDFIFSSHVFEHLSNPLQVLRNWCHALRPGGVVLTVVPDARFCFDCRQPFTTLAEALHEEQVGGHVITASKYERWCKLTSPNQKVEKLMATGYSIHVSFFTPETLRPLLEELKRRDIIDHFSILAARNHKDFGFLARKARSTQ